MKGQRISKSQLHKGLYVKLPLRWHEHPFLRSAFEVSTAEEVALIKKLPLDYLLYFPEKSSTTLKTVEEVIKAKEETLEIEPTKEEVVQLSVDLHKHKQEQIKEMAALRNRQSECEQQYKQSILKLRLGISEMGRNPERACTDIKGLSTELSSIASAGPLTMHLIDKKIDNDEHFVHTLNVAVFALMIGKMRGYSEHEMTELLMGAFLHDIGLIDINQPMGADGKMALASAAKYREQHTIFGVRMVEDFEVLTPNVLNVIQNHHEYFDGSGFPKGLQGDAVDDMSQIVSIANMYDDICQPQKSGKAYQPSSAIALLYKNMKSKFRPDLLELFVKMIGIYPPGSIVLLSDQNAAMVLSNNHDALLKPNVVVYDVMIPRDQAPIVDLSQTDLSVKQVVKQKSVPQHIYDYLCPSSKFHYFFDTTV
ncbi:HD-GYP domain-containing protein [Enterovibrio calviensis]|uniref:HD-GYP domain-containing protein n=1 Tax=Enterovibrio calviensis TaxID=91359 RepID=UPI0004841231|nr:HD domain-containing phosphohydrolase [Enterovibrio calviensis]